MGGAIEAPEKQASPYSYSFYYHSLVTRHNNAGRFISINFTGVHIHLSICKLCLLTMLIFMGCPCVCVVALCLCVCMYIPLCTRDYVCVSVWVGVYKNLIED